MPPSPATPLFDRHELHRLYTSRARELATQLGRQYPRFRLWADDAVQHAFLKLAACGEPVRDPGGWVARAANNYMIDVARRDGRLAYETDTFRLDTMPARPPHEDDEDDERQRAVAVMGRALEEIGEPGRSMLVLKYMHGCDYEQIAETLGVPRGSIGTTLLRARRRLRDLIVAQGVSSSAA